MARNYNSYLNKAREYRLELENALSSDNQKNILYYRGKYLLELKKAHKYNPAGVVPPLVSGLVSDVTINDLINQELEEHQDFIDYSIKNNKKNSSIKNKTFSKEAGLKIRRLSTRIDQINFSSDKVSKDDLKGEMVKDSAGLVGTAIKAPIMATAKVASKVGPLAVTICVLPFKVFVSLLTVVNDISNGKSSPVEEYNNTVVDKMTKSLQEAVRDVSTVIYDTTGRI